MPDKTWFATFLVGMVIELPTAALWAGYAFLGTISAPVLRTISMLRMVDIQAWRPERYPRAGALGPKMNPAGREYRTSRG